MDITLEYSKRRKAYEREQRMMMILDAVALLIVGGMFYILVLAIN